MEDKFNEQERLIMLSMYKQAIDAKLSELRGGQNALLIDSYYETGADRMRLRLRGNECMTLSIRRTKPTTKTEVYVEDVRKAANYIAVECQDSLESLLLNDLELLSTIADALFKKFGECADGVTIREVSVPERVSTMAKIDEDAVIGVMSNLSITHPQLMLEAFNG